MKKIKNGWPKINMKPASITVNADGVKNLDEAKMAKNESAWPLGYEQWGKPDLVESRGSIYPSKKM